MNSFKKALLIIFCFVTLSSWSQEKAKNIILLIGDGMGTAQVYAGYTANKGQLNLLDFPYSGFLITHSASDYVTDSGAGATAIATGTKTYNGAISVDTLKNPLKTILEYAEENNMKTGLVATSSITHATPASFIAHEDSRNNYEAIALDFLDVDIDVFIGGGLKNFDQRKDNRKLTEELKAKGYQIALDTNELKQINEGSLAGLVFNGHPPSYRKRGNYLELAASKAIELLDNENGFFLMIESSQIDWAGHRRDAGYLVDEMLDFDRTIGKVLQYAKEEGNTLVIVTADHETGGLTITKGDLESGSMKTKFSTLHHTSVMVPIFSYGPYAEKFSGMMDNTQLFFLMMEAYGF